MEVGRVVAQWTVVGGQLVRERVNTHPRLDLKGVNMSENEQQDETLDSPYAGDVTQDEEVEQ